MKLSSLLISLIITNFLDKFEKLKNYVTAGWVDTSSMLNTTASN